MLKSFFTFFITTASIFMLALPNAAKASDFSDEAFFAMEAETDGELDQVRGMAIESATGDITVGQVDSLGIFVGKAVTANNSNIGDSGDNIIGGDAFSGARGVLFALQNSGNQAAINASFIVTVNFQDGLGI